MHLQQTERTDLIKLTYEFVVWLPHLKISKKEEAHWHCGR